MSEDRTGTGEATGIAVGDPAIVNGDRILMGLMWPGLTLLVVIMIGSVVLVLGVAWAAGTQGIELGRLLSEAHSITRLVSLLIIVPTIWTLTMRDKVNGAAAIAALSAIAGYVLGGTTGAGSP